MDKQFKQKMVSKANQVIEAYKYALRTGEWREYFSLFSKFADECEENHVDPEAFFLKRSSSLWTFHSVFKEVGNERF